MITVPVLSCSGAASLGAAVGGSLPDSSFTASSTYDNLWHPQNGRLNHVRHCWVPGRSQQKNPNEYLQVDLRTVSTVCAVATQGSHYSQSEYVKTYKLMTSSDGLIWKVYQEHGATKVSSWMA